MSTTTTPPPVCPYCGSQAVLVDSRVMYRRSYGLLWVCGNYPTCDAYVGCHRGGDRPLGRLADAELRAAKMKAHAAFDPLWRRGGMSRNAAYRWLSEQLGIDGGQCHIGMFDVETCKRVVEVCRRRREVNAA